MIFTFQSLFHSNFFGGKLLNLLNHRSYDLRDIKRFVYYEAGLLYRRQFECWVVLLAIIGASELLRLWIRQCE